MSVSSPFIERPIATSLLVAAIVLLGVVAFPLLPISALPQVDFPTISVSAKLPGASPETMAVSVAAPLEKQFAQISGLTQMTSSSASGTTQITLQFNLGRDIDGAAQDVQAAITVATKTLPKTLSSPPSYRKVNPADAPIMIVALDSDTLPITVVDQYADTILAQQMSQLPGVAQVQISGEQRPSIRVQVDPVKMASIGIGLEDLRAALTSATVNSPKGSFNGATQTFTIYNNDQLLRAEEYNNVIITYRNGSPIRVSDVGQAIDGPEDTHLAGWQNGHRGIQLMVFKQPGANVIETAKGVHDALPRLQAVIPPAIHVSIITDRTQTIRASVDDVEFTMILTVGLVVMVIFLFLRNVWATAIPSITLPITIIGTFAAMYLLNYSLDNLSLMAITIAVGFVVDDAIVMLENIYRHVEDGMSPMEAAIKGAGEIGFTIVSISMSLIAVLIPLLLMGGIVGRLFREFAVTVAVTIVVSAIVSLTLTPMMCSRFLKHQDHPHHGRLYMMAEGFFDWLLRTYDTGLKWVLRHQRTTITVMLATMCATGYLYVVIPKGFFPQQDTGFISGFSVAAQDISFDAMADHQKALAEIVQQDPAIAAFSYTAGATGGSQTINNGKFYIQLKPRAQRDVTADQVINRLRPKLAKVEGITLFLQASQDLNVGGRVGRTQYQYTLQDADLSELNEWAPKVQQKLSTLQELRDVTSDQQTNAPSVTMTIDRDTASRLGIQPQLIDETLYDAFGQRQVAQYFTQVDQYNVVLEIDPKLQGDPSTLDKIYIKSTTTGRQVPLSAFVHLNTTKTNYLSIAHQGQFPAVTVSFNLAPRVALGTAIEAIQKANNEINTPKSLVGTFQGTAQAFQSSLASQPYLILAAIITVYIILGVLYESYIHPITILSTLPSAGLGALLILVVSGYDLSVIALIGILLLIGIVKKNAIMMIDFALDAERRQGLSPEDSIYQACLLRFRPIMMTTMAALLGALPLMLGTGTGSELRRPLGFAIVGGLMVSQVLTLYTTPVVYLYMDRLHRWMTGGKKAAPTAPRMSHAQRILSLEPAE